MVMPGPEIGISRHLFLSSGSYILSAPSLSKKNIILVISYTHNTQCLPSVLSLDIRHSPASLSTHDLRERLLTEHFCLFR